MRSQVWPDVNCQIGFALNVNVAVVQAGQQESGFIAKTETNTSGSCAGYANDLLQIQSGGGIKASCNTWGETW
eukprot:6827701-Lingulodinium_polyedra.AAC.1